MTRPLRYLALASCLVSIPLSSHAQDESAASDDGQRLLRPPALRKIEPPVLPEGSDWILVAREVGGIAGIDHQATIDSTGTIECTGFRLPCPDNLTPEALEQFDRKVRQASPFRWSGSRAVGSDLLTRMVILVVRVEGESRTANYRAYWDLTPPEGAEEAGMIHELVRILVYP